MAHARDASIDQSNVPDEPLLEIAQLDGDLSAEFTLAGPVRVEIWIEGDEFVADVPEFNLHAFGATRDDALGNVRARIIEQRQRLSSQGSRLSDVLREEAARLQLAVVPRHA